MLDRKHHIYVLGNDTESAIQRSTELTLKMSDGTTYDREICRVVVDERGAVEIFAREGILVRTVAP